MKQRRTWIVSGGALLLVGLLLALVLLSRPKQAGDFQKATLTLKWLYDPGFAGEMIAAKKGYMQAEGLDLAIQPGGFEIDPVRLVASNASQFGVVGADTFLIARSRGIPIVAIGAGYIHTAAGYYVHADSDVRTVRDFAGKTVGIQAGQDTETILYAMLGAAGVSRDAIKAYPAKYDLSPFLQRTVDVWPGYVATQSYTLRQQNVPFRVIRPADVGLRFPGTVYFTTERFRSSHPEIVAGFMRAVKKGWEYAYSNQDEAAKIVASYDPNALPVPLVLSNLADQRDQILPDGYNSGEIRLTDWEVLQLALQQQGLLVGPVNLAEALKPMK